MPEDPESEQTPLALPPNPLHSGIIAGMIREVETDTDGRVLVTVEEPVDRAIIPQRCAGCLGEPTKALAVVGTRLEFPYCDECVPRRPWEDQRRAVQHAAGLLVVVALGYFVSWLFLILGFLVLAALSQRSGERTVKLLVSESGTVRLAFAHAEYAREFVEANGGEE